MTSLDSDNAPRSGETTAADIATGFAALFTGDTCLACRKPHPRSEDAPYCPECEANQADEAADEPTPEEVKRAERLERFAEKVDVEYRETVLELLPAAARRAVPTMEAFDFKAGKGITITGDTGQGKTRLAAMALRAAALQGASVAVLRCAEMRMRLWGSFQGAAEEVRQATRPTVLLLDDIGQGAKTEQIDEVMLAILEQRTAKRLPTITTSQWPASELVGRFYRPETGQAICRRIGKQFAEIITLK